MVFVRETTTWTGNTPNHVYVLDDRMHHMIAYVPAGSRRVTRFKNPIAFDRKGRTFVPLDDHAPEPSTVQVSGSKGQTYIVARDGSSCTCPGYQYRGECRHVAEQQQKNTG